MEQLQKISNMVSWITDLALSVSEPAEPPVPTEPLPPNSTPPPTPPVPPEPRPPGPDVPPPSELLGSWPFLLEHSAAAAAALLRLKTVSPADPGEIGFQWLAGAYSCIGFVGRSNRSYKGYVAHLLLGHASAQRGKEAPRRLHGWQNVLQRPSIQTILPSAEGDRRRNSTG